MFDLITYVKDSAAFLKEVETKFPTKVVMSEDPMVDGKVDPNFVHVPVSVTINKTPTIRNTAGTLSVVRCDAAELADIKTLTTVKILSEVAPGDDPLVTMIKANRKIYDSIHNQTPVAMLDDKGSPMLDTAGKALFSTPPALIGAFA